MQQRNGWKTAFWTLAAVMMAAPLSERIWGWRHYKGAFENGDAYRCVVRSADWSMPWWLWGGYALAAGALVGLIGFLWHAGGKVIAKRDEVKA